LLEVQIDRLDVEAAGLDLGEIEDVVNEREQGFAVGIGDGGELALFLAKGLSVNNRIDFRYWFRQDGVIPLSMKRVGNEVQ
jgi:hypothetical protein